MQLFAMISVPQLSKIVFLNFFFYMSATLKSFQSCDVALALAINLTVLIALVLGRT